MSANPLKALRVDGAEAELSGFVDPGMNLSSSKSGMTRHVFDLIIDIDEMIAFLTPAYDAAVKAWSREDAVHGVDDDLGRAGYPGLRELTSTPDLLLDMLQLMRFDFLEPLTGTGEGPFEYWFDEMTGCRVAGGDIILSGTCYSNPPRYDSPPYDPMTLMDLFRLIRSAIARLFGR